MDQFVYKEMSGRLPPPSTPDYTTGDYTKFLCINALILRSWCVTVLRLSPSYL